MEIMKQLLFTPWNLSESCCNVYLAGEHVGDIFEEFGSFTGYFNDGASLVGLASQSAPTLELCTAKMQNTLTLHLAENTLNEAEIFLKYGISYIAISPENDQEDEPTSTH